MSHYKSNVRDLEFNLFELFGVGKVFGEGRFSDLDLETAREMLAEMSRMAAGPIAESFVEGDRNPPVFDPQTHSVTLPESFKKSVHAVLEAGWDRVGVSEELGGVPMPTGLAWALREMLFGANPAVWFYVGGAGFAGVVYDLGTEDRRSGRSWPPSGAGAQRWCSPSQTPALMWAPRAPRPPNATTARGTSTG
jgi:alkylation response protein AidB-like acyl-CoA dehydrogenase